MRRGLSRFTARLPMDLVHGPNYSVPECEGKTVVTFHDLSVFRYPELHPAERVADFERNVRRSIERADHLITDCETIRQEVIAFTGFHPERVRAVPLGVSKNFRPLAFEDRVAVLERHSLPLTGYGLTISSIEPRKRIERLVGAWRLLPSSLRDRYPLVIAGAQGWKNDVLLEEIKAAAEKGWAILLGFLPEEDLPAIYAGAALFVYPSVYEGFGLPPLEAMASGIPTVVATGSCLEEVTKGVAMLGEPEDEEGFARTICRALEDHPWRKSASSSGIQVASGYTWQRCIDETVAVYQRVTGNSTMSEQS
jgi:glycosyltransferase involved in cell wall biosynthesis